MRSISRVLYYVRIYLDKMLEVKYKSGLLITPQRTIAYSCKKKVIVLKFECIKFTP